MPQPTNAVAHPTLVRFTRRLAHDLNNFTTVVSTYSELLLADLDPASPTYADVEEIRRASEGMVAYLARVTRFARASAMKRELVDVDAGVAAAVDAFRSEFPSRELAVAGATGASILADPQWWPDIVEELLRNAQDAAPPGTPIRLSLTRETGCVALTVRDSGPGIDTAVAEEVCDPLVTSKEGVRGAGIGLTLVAAFTEALGGTLEAGRVDQTTVVTLALPTA